jgi:hypothetical protein
MENVWPGKVKEYKWVENGWVKQELSAIEEELLIIERCKSKIATAKENIGWLKANCPDLANVKSITAKMKISNIKFEESLNNAERSLEDLAKKFEKEESEQI